MNTINPTLEDLQLRWKKIQEQMKFIGADACLIASNVNLYYMSGLIFGGYIYLATEGEPVYFVRRSAGLVDSKMINIRKPEDIPMLLKEKGLQLPKYLLLEGDQLTYNDYLRLQTALSPEKVDNASPILRTIRSVKTPWEIEQFRVSTAKHAEAYRHIKSCYHPGISDLEFQFNIEKYIRLTGSLGLFRGFGSNMEIYMGSVLAGENAESPSPYDFALGGHGIHPSAPVGANGTILKPGTTVMVDMGGTFTAYISDMTRVFSIGKLPDIAYKAHQVAIDIQNEVMLRSEPGVSCADLYKLSVEIAQKADLGQYFMGTKQQAKFVGHGVGIEINELPVFTERSKELLNPGMVFALEPKFVLPQIGAVGVENTFLVTEKGVEKLTLLEENIIDLEG